MIPRPPRSSLIPYTTLFRSNCDFWDFSFLEEKLIILEGKRIFLTHGHLYGVKTNYDSLREISLKMKYDIILFGHTHREFLEIKDQILANPGADRKSTRLNSSHANISYAVFCLK